MSLLKTPRDGILAMKVTRDEANAFNPMYHPPPCTSDDFRLYLEGTPAHPWNKAAMMVFIQSFCATFPQYKPDETEARFKVHLETLIRKYKTQQRLKDNREAQDEAKKKNRKNTRKATVSPFPSMKGFTMLSQIVNSSLQIVRRRCKVSQNCKGTDG